ncbi:MAG: hypothetical protein Q8P72_05460 [Candidatus Roizmanbacteria bacterium]|nr:hypothetical protein [Candidatus Roizmanbacteria bacterium]
MNIKTLLKQKGIDLDKPVLQINRLESLVSITEAMNEYCPSVKIEKMSKDDIEVLADSLGENIVNYHPENYHQERGALLGNIDMLKKYGLTDEDIRRIDFC